MKRIIYILTAIFSAVAAAIFIIDIIGYIIEIAKIIPDISPEGEFSYNFYFPIFAANLVPSILRIAVLLALGVLSLVQLKKHTPRIILILSGYVFFDSVLTISGQYLFSLLLMAAALIPAVYELSRYGMAVRLEPKRNEKKRWLLIVPIALALALAAYRVMVSIVKVELGFNVLYICLVDIIGVSALLSATVFCALMNRRTSVLYRMFFTGCFLYNAVQLFFTQYSWFPGFFRISDTVKMFFSSMAALSALFALLIFLHAFLTRRGSLINPITQKAPVLTAQAEMRS